MRKRGYATSCAVLMGMCCLAPAGDPSKIENTRSLDLDRVVQLQGTWRGKSDMGRGEEEVVVTYRLTAAGSSLIETIQPGSPMEMVSVYHDDPGGTLTMTHYCTLGNQPRLNLSGSDGKSVSLSLAADSGLDVAKEDHMHALKLVFVDDNTIEQHWSFYEGGKEKEVHITRLVRAR